MALTSLTLLCLLAARPPPRPAPLPAAAPAPFSARPASLEPEAKKLPTPALMERVRTLNQELELDLLVPFARELVTRSDAPLELKREAWLMLGSSLVILGDPVAAEVPFIQLLRVVPDFELPASLEPKVALVFKKVQAEERELARALKVQARQALIARIAIRGPPPEGAKGGQPIAFQYQLDDPALSVRSVRLAYRRAGDGDFSSLPLVEQPARTWSVRLPGDASGNEGGLRLEYYVETADGEGPLKTLGTAAAPLALEVAPGRFEVPRRPPLPRWLFFTSAGLTVAAGAVGGTLLYDYQARQTEYRRYVNMNEALSLAYVEQLQAQGRDAATRATAALITAGALLAVTVVVALLVDWSPEAR